MSSDLIRIIGERFPPRARLRRKQQFALVFREGWRVGSSGLRLVIRENNTGYSRLGLAVGRRIGTAPTRNRLKRRLREIFRRHRADFPSTFDVVIIPKRGAAEMTKEDLEAQLLALIQSWRPRPRRSQSSLPPSSAETTR